MHQRGLSDAPILPAAVAPLLAISRLPDFRGGDQGDNATGRPVWGCHPKAGRLEGRRPGAERTGRGRGSRAREARGPPCGVGAPPPPRPARESRSVPRALRHLPALRSRWSSARNYGSALLPGRLRRGRLPTWTTLSLFT